MRGALQLHPKSLCAAVTAIAVSAERPNPRTLALTYLMTGAIADLSLPPPTQAGRAHDLWRRTCFEAFLRAGPGPAYFEFNFAPSSQWAAYAFDGYRQGMRDQAAAVEIDVATSADRLELRASLDVESLPPAAPWRLGLCAVIEETNGALTYWALAHPPGRADFHHEAGFACQLPPMENA